MVVTDELHTSAQLRQTQQALAASQADLSRAERERDEARHCWSHAEFQLTTATARIAALTDDLRSAELERDGVREELTRQAEANEDLTGTLAMRTGQLRRLREDQEIRARLLREKNAKLRGIEHLLGIDAIVPHCDAADAIRELLAELEQLRAQLSTSLHTEEPPA